MSSYNAKAQLHFAIVYLQRAQEHFKVFKKFSVAIYLFCLIYFSIMPHLQPQQSDTECLSSCYISRGFFMSLNLINVYWWFIWIIRVITDTLWLIRPIARYKGPRPQTECTQIFPRQEFDQCAFPLRQHIQVPCLSSHREGRQIEILIIALKQNS